MGPALYSLTVPPVTHLMNFGYRHAFFPRYPETLRCHRESHHPSGNIVGHRSYGGNRNINLCLTAYYPVPPSAFVCRRLRCSTNPAFPRPVLPNFGYSGHRLQHIGIRQARECWGQPPPKTRARRLVRILCNGGGGGNRTRLCRSRRLSEALENKGFPGCGVVPCTCPVLPKGAASAGASRSKPRTPSSRFPGSRRHSGGGRPCSGKARS